jgi:hypothetical protein
MTNFQWLEKEKLRINKETGRACEIREGFTRNCVTVALFYKEEG